jgi:phosphatidylglycerophosphatase A
MSRMITTVFGLGHLRPAPGTWASLVTVLIGLLVWRVLGFPGLALLTAAVTAAGFIACAEDVIHDDDPPEVVIDEVAGQLLTLLFPAAAFWLQDWGGWLPWPALLASFALFRLFDIWKPGPVGWVDRRNTPSAVMLDDLVAGVLAGLGVLILGAAWHAVLMLTP